MRPHAIRRASAVLACLALLASAPGCGKNEADRFGKPALEIAGCGGGKDVDLWTTHRNPDPMWPGAEDAYNVHCGSRKWSDPNLLLAVAEYPSQSAALSAATTLGRQRLLCIVDNWILESWITPVGRGPRGALATERSVRAQDALRRTAAQDFCSSIHGTSRGHWRSLQYSSQR